MKQLGRKLWGVSLLLLLMVVGFQNCSQAQFGQTTDLDQTVLSSTEGDSTSDSSPSGQLDLVTPRIVLSDRYNGVGKASFSPNQVIYVYCFFLSDARDKIDDWHWRYNNFNPHSALGMKSPIEFAMERDTMLAS